MGDCGRPGGRESRPLCEAYDRLEGDATVAGAGAPPLEA